MFTGIIQSVGKLLRSEAIGGDLRLHIDIGELEFSDVQLGESIAVSGVCLTVVSFTQQQFCADVSQQTLRLTSLGGLQDGAALNLERALRLADRLGGHTLSGHVDGVGKVIAIESEARAQNWRFSAPAELLRFIALKGSIAVDGVSLTISALHSDGFSVALIPHTVSQTIFANHIVGTQVNLEVDILARYLDRLMQFQNSPNLKETD